MADNSDIEDYSIESEPQQRLPRANYSNNLEPISNFIEQIQLDRESTWKTTCIILLSFIFGAACLTTVGMIKIGLLPEDFCRGVTPLLMCSVASFLPGGYLLARQHKKNRLDAKI